MRKRPPQVRHCGRSHHQRATDIRLQLEGQVRVPSVWPVSCAFAALGVGTAHMRLRFSLRLATGAGRPLRFVCAFVAADPAPSVVGGRQRLQPSSVPLIAL